MLTRKRVLFTGGTAEISPRKSSITGITSTVAAPILGLRSASTCNPSGTIAPNTTTIIANTYSSGHVTRTSEESVSTRPKLSQLLLNKDKVQQPLPLSPTSPTASLKGIAIIPPSYSTPLEGETSNTNIIHNNNYITSPNPNSSGSISRSHQISLTATQLTGVKNWWKNQMECLSSDEEW